MLSYSVYSPLPHWLGACVTCLHHVGAEAFDVWCALVLLPALNFAFCHENIMPQEWLLLRLLSQNEKTHGIIQSPVHVVHV